MNSKKTFFVFLVMMLFAGINTAFGATLTVSTTTDEKNTNGQCSLREALTNINNGGNTYSDCVPSGTYGTSDTVNIPAGTYTITITGGGEELNATGDYDILKSVSIIGAGSSNTILSGGSLDRVFHIDPVEQGFDAPVTVSISGVTITEGLASGFYGGGIHNFGILTVSNSTITDNIATGSVYGGGIYNSDNTLTVLDSTVSNNTAEGGGGIHNDGGTLAVVDSTINGNTASNSGGGIESAGALTITNSTISSNTASNTDGYVGGGIYYSGSSGTIANTTINGNTSNRGGGIFNDGTLTITNSTISNNLSSSLTGGGDYHYGSGGGIVSYGTLGINSSTITRNSAPGYIGGIVKAGGSITISNSIVANQTSGPDCFSALTSNGYNLESSTSCEFTQTGDMQNTDPLLGPLQDNGGPTFTHALLEGSLALDAADPNNYPETDQRGESRPQGAGPDIGAYENVGQASPLPDLTGEWYEPFTEKCSTKTEGLICRVKGKLILRNIGEADAPNIKIRFYFSEDGSYGEGDMLLEEGTKDGVLVGKAYKKSFKLTLPVGMSLADGYIIVYIDADNTTTESDESNNFVVYGEEG